MPCRSAPSGAWTRRKAFLATEASDLAGEEAEYRPSPKTIVGRGSRLDAATGKYWFRVIDFRDATRLFDQ